MNLDKLPSRYSKMSDDPGITGDASIAARLMLAKGGKPGALRVDGQPELENVILRPGFLRWKKDDPIFNLKAKAERAPSLQTQDLMASLAARHLLKLEKKVERGQDVSEFVAAKPKVVAGATKMTTLNGFGDEASDVAEEAKRYARFQRVAATQRRKTIFCCLVCIAGSGLVTYLLIKQGVIKV